MTAKGSLEDLRSDSTQSRVLQREERRRSDDSLRQTGNQYSTDGGPDREAYEMLFQYIKSSLAAVEEMKELETQKDPLQSIGFNKYVAKAKANRPELTPKHHRRQNCNQIPKAYQVRSLF